MGKSAFYAYPSSATIVVDAAREATAICQEKGLKFSIKTWEELDIPGKFIATEILSEIESHDFFIADISRLNFNVTYEIGYAIGKGKRIVLLKHRAVKQESPSMQEVGIFDTLNYFEYSTANEICDRINNMDFNDLIPLPTSDKLNEKSPIYLVQPKTKTDYDGLIISGIKKSYLFFKSFDPAESNRLAGPEAITNVSESYGVILHFLPDEHVDSKIHNIRSAFVAGVADGLDKRSLYIQTGETPIPLDLRDFVTPCRFRDQFKDAIGKLAERVYEDRDINIVRPKGDKSKLAEIDLGASAAENEITSLAEYYLETEAFRRAQRKEVRLVTGRKGSGKTAIFFMLRDIVRSKRKNVVLDLKPEGYQLLKLKDSIIHLLSVGTVEHTITAFWEYLLWLELCYKLLEKDQELHKRDHDLFEPYQRLKATYITDTYSNEGDFAERLNLLLRDIIETIEAKYQGLNGVDLTTQQVTELVYRHDFYKLKKNILEYLKYKDEIWLLFDNIDKGWATQGVKPEDLIIIRALIEATRKIERDLEKCSISAHTIVFLRNDVFEQLVDTTADRGKETRVNVDWDDSEMLKELIRLRISRSSALDEKFTTMWTSICIPIIDGEESSQYLIDRCLMRPRSLLDLIGHCRGYAMNLGHERILKEDILKGCSAFSNDLLTELDLEIRDVFPAAENLLYAFIGSPSTISREVLIAKLSEHGVNGVSIDIVIKLLLWFGFIGLVWGDGTYRYIYSVHYNMKVLDGIHNQLIKAKSIKYVLNPAFTSALGLI